jgi:hypothetical protein
MEYCIRIACETARQSEAYKGMTKEAKSQHVEGAWKGIPTDEMVRRYGDAAQQRIKACLDHIKLYDDADDADKIPRRQKRKKG